MTRRVGSKGQVVTPEHLRDELWIEPGEDEMFQRDDDQVSLRQPHPRAPLRGRFQAAGLSDVLAAERRWSP